MGVSAAAPVAVAAAGAPAGELPLLLSKRRPPLTLFSRRREATRSRSSRKSAPLSLGLGLAESKGARRERSKEALKEGITKEEAEEIRKKIEAVGAKVEIK